MRPGGRVSASVSAVSSRTAACALSAEHRRSTEMCKHGTAQCSTAMEYRAALTRVAGRWPARDIGYVLEGWRWHGDQCVDARSARIPLAVGGGGGVEVAVAGGVDAVAMAVVAAAMAVVVAAAQVRGKVKHGQAAGAGGAASACIDKTGRARPGQAEPSASSAGASACQRQSHVTSHCSAPAVR